MQRRNRCRKKTEVIYHTVNELSNGLNILNSLIKQGYVKERNDEEDKRSKRVSVTLKGEKILAVCYERIHKVSELLFFEMSGDDIMLCIQLLKNVEMKFSGQWMKFSGQWLLHKNKPFNETYRKVIENRKHHLPPEHNAQREAACRTQGVASITNK